MWTHRNLKLIARLCELNFTRDKVTNISSMLHIAQSVQWLGLSPCRGKGCSAFPKLFDRLWDKRYISLPQSIHTGPRANPGAVSSVVNRPARETDHSPLTSAKIMEKQSHTSSPPYVFIVYTGTALHYLWGQPKVYRGCFLRREAVEAWSPFSGEIKNAWTYPHKGVSSRYDAWLSKE
jgi:hypothetical protein